MSGLKRWVQLSFITVKYAVFFLLRFLRLYPDSYPKLMRLYFQEAGGVLVKIGQILALRYEILPPQYCWELSELFDNVSPLNYYEVKKIIIEELGSDPSEIFSVLEEQPVASASFAQVHKGVLNNGRIVAVKIQRPGLHLKVRHDFKFLRILSFLIKPFFQLRALPIGEIFKELEQTTILELDYRLEKDNAEIIRNNVLKSNSEKIVVPKTYTELTTNRVMVQDFIEGTKLNDILRLKQGQTFAQADNSFFDLKQISLDIVTEMAREYFVDGIYHSDPHPGNIIITHSGKIALVDFGIVGHVKPYSRALFWDFIRPVAVNQDSSKAAKAFLRLGLKQIEEKIRFLAQDRKEPVDVYFDMVEELSSTYEKSLGTIINNWSQSIIDPAESVYNRSTAVAFLKAMRIAEQYNVRFQRDLILFIRALVIADMMAMQLSPGFRIDQALKNFADQNEEKVSELEESIKEFIPETDKFRDPWNEDVRNETKEFIYEWYQDLVDSRPMLKNKLKFSISRMKSLL